MKIRIEDITQIAVADVRYLTDHLIRFRFEKPRVAPVDWDRMEAASREFNFDHFCAPSYLYTNGQALETLVQRGERQFEVRRHESAIRYFDLPSVAADSSLLKPCGLTEDAVSLPAAELSIRRRLVGLRVLSLSMRKGDETANVTLQPAGATRGPSGYRIDTYHALFRGATSVIRIGDDQEGYRVLNEFQPEGYRVVSCATCINFRFSAMARDWSNGFSGYCNARADEGSRRSSRSPVNVIDACPEYSFIEDRARRAPYIRD